MSDAFQALQKTITEVGQLQARLIAENKRLRDENKRLAEQVAAVVARRTVDGDRHRGAHLHQQQTQRIRAVRIEGVPAPEVAS